MIGGSLRERSAFATKEDFTCLAGISQRIGTSLGAQVGLLGFGLNFVILIIQQPNQFSLVWLAISVRHGLKNLINTHRWQICQLVWDSVIVSNGQRVFDENWLQFCFL